MISEDDRKISPLDKLLQVEKMSEDKINIQSTRNLKNQSPSSLNTNANIQYRPAPTLNKPEDKYKNLKFKNMRVFQEDREKEIREKKKEQELKE